MSSFILKYLLVWLTAKKQEQASWKIANDSKGLCTCSIGQRDTCEFPVHLWGLCQLLPAVNNRWAWAVTEHYSKVRPWHCWQTCLVVLPGSSGVWHSLLGHFTGLLLLHEIAGFPLLGLCSYQAPVDLPLGCCCVFWNLGKLDYQKYIPSHVSNKKPLSLW